MNRIRRDCPRCGERVMIMSEDKPGTDHAIITNYIYCPTCNHPFYEYENEDIDRLIKEWENGSE